MHLCIPFPSTDITTKGILHAAFERCEYWRLSDAAGKPPGLMGWWPSRAVTFLENHDTGSTQVGAAAAAACCRCCGWGQQLAGQPRPER